jgi:hypothetical protein
MEAKSQRNIVEDQLQMLIKGFEKERDKHKSRGLLLKLSTAGLAAIATVLLGWQEAPAFATSFKNLALVANALITLLAAYEAFFEPRKLWVRETAVLNKLKDVRRELEVELAEGDPSPARLHSYVDRVTEILKSSLDSWLKDKSANTT